MYLAYFVNITTGELFRSGKPQDNKCDIFFPQCDSLGWSRVSGEMFDTLVVVQRHGERIGMQEVIVDSKSWYK